MSASNTICDNKVENGSELALKLKRGFSYLAARIALRNFPLLRNAFIR